MKRAVQIDIFTFFLYCFVCQYQSSDWLWNDLDSLIKLHSSDTSVWCNFICESSFTCMSDCLVHLSGCWFTAACDGATDLLTVSETATEPPQEEGSNLNSPKNLSLEATFVNHNFSQQVLKIVSQVFVMIELWYWCCWWSIVIMNVQVISSYLSLTGWLSHLVECEPQTSRLDPAVLWVVPDVSCLDFLLSRCYSHCSDSVLLLATVVLHCDIVCLLFSPTLALRHLIHNLWINPVKPTVAIWVQL